MNSLSQLIAKVLNIILNLMLSTTILGFAIITKVSLIKIVSYLFTAFLVGCLPLLLIICLPFYQFFHYYDVSCLFTIMSADCLLLCQLFVYFSAAVFCIIVSCLFALLPAVCLPFYQLFVFYLCLLFV